MTVQIKDVRCWLLLRGIGHAVASTCNGWHHVACGTLTPNGVLRKRKPTRICRKCRDALQHGWVFAGRR